MRFYPLDKLINLHDGYTRKFRIDHVELLLVQRNGERYVFESRCPHREQPLEDAVIDAGRLECPRHRYRFSLQDGALLTAGEERCRGLRVYPLAYEGNELGVVLGD